MSTTRDEIEAVTPENFLHFFDPLPEAVLFLSGAGSVLAGNHAISERLDISPGEIEGMKLADLVEEPADEVTHDLRHCSRNRKPVLGALVFRNRGGSIHCRTDGNLVTPRAERSDAFLLLRLFPKQTSVGQFLALNERIEELGREILRRKNAEEAAREQEERLRVILQSIGDAVITEMNPVAEILTGWMTADAVGQPFTGHAIGDSGMLGMKCQKCDDGSQKILDIFCLCLLATSGTRLLFPDETLLRSLGFQFCTYARDYRFWSPDSAREDFAAPLLGHHPVIAGSLHSPCQGGVTWR